jgi:uncharacterized protein (TIGR02466 family)
MNNLNIQRVDTFASPIWMMGLEDLKIHRDMMVKKIMQLRAEADASLKQKSNRNGWHSDLRILELPEFQHLKKKLIEISKVVLKDYGIDPGNRVVSFAAWANVHDKGGYNVSHVHPGSWISGSFYLNVPEGSGRIYFEDPRQATRVEHIPLGKMEDKKNNPLYSRGKFNVLPKEMMLVMFPGWFEHGVEHSEAENRISIAFNITPIQMTEEQLQKLSKLANNKPIELLS